MEKEILILKNITREGPGLIEDIIKEYGIKHTIIDLSREQSFQTLDDYGAVVVLGGPDSANDTSRKIVKELDLIREILKANIPYLGICLGLQTLVKAAGGQVVKSQPKETGFRDPNDEYFRVELTEDGKNDKLFQDLGNSFNVFQLHGETVLLTETMNLLGVGKFCRNQIVKIGSNAYGIQCHFELTTQMFETWIDEDVDLSNLDRTRLQSDYTVLKDELAQTGSQLFRNFLKIAGF